MTMPIIKGLTGKIMTLERKINHAKGQFEKGTVSPESASWFRREIEAYEAAVEALRYHRVALERVSPVKALRDLLAAYELPLERATEIRAAVEQAQEVLQEHDR